MQVFDVLILDPAEDVRRELYDYLAAKDLSVIGVGTIEDALEILQQNAVRLIVTELMLPIGSFYKKRVSNSLMTGMYFIEDIRAGKINCLVYSFPVIVFTGLASEGTLDRVRKIIGKDNVFLKPGHADEILKAVQGFLVPE